MAAAALLRSMARKLARAPPVTPRPLLACARSGPGASLPPLTSNQRGLRSGSALPSLATKIARALPQPHHPRLLTRRLHTGGTTTDKDKIIEHLRRDLRLARAVTGIGAVSLIGLTQFWLMPRLKQLKAYERLVRELRGADEDHMRQQSNNGTTEKGTGVDKLEEGDVMAVSLDILKETAASLEDERPRAEIIQTAGHIKQQGDRTAEKGIMLVGMLLMLPLLQVFILFFLLHILLQVGLDNLKEITPGHKEARANLSQARAAMERTTELASSKSKEDGKV